LNKIKYVFISNLKPDYFGGFPGTYLSAREDSAEDQVPWDMTVLGPQGMRNKFQKSTSFMGRMKNLRIIEYT